jgi:co-chaperonin GroES (HSP10)
MNIQLLRDHVIVRPIPREQIGLIELPESLKDDNNVGGAKLYWVMLAGPGKRNKKGIVIPLECEYGDRVWVHSYTKGVEVVGLPHGDVIITYDQILMVLPKVEPS